MTESGDPATDTSAKRQLLVVDDDRDVCECLEQFFSTRGFAVTSAFSGEQALDRVATASPEVVIVDILLPGISGIEVLRRVKARCPSAKVIMITGLPYLELRGQACAYGACGYVTKPFDFSEETWAPILSR
jgi:DNA-binding response OmpR family regulator